MPHAYWLPDPGSDFSHCALRIYSSGYTRGSSPHDCKTAQALCTLTQGSLARGTQGPPLGAVQHWARATHRAPLPQLRGGRAVCPWARLFSSQPATVCRTPTHTGRVIFKCHLLLEAALARGSADRGTSSSLVLWRPRCPQSSLLSRRLQDRSQCGWLLKALGGKHPSCVEHQTAGDKCIAWGSGL